MDDYETVVMEQDPIKMLELIREVAYNVQTTAYYPATQYHITWSFHLQRQENRTPLRMHLAKFQIQVDMLLSVGINLRAGPGMENFIATFKTKTGSTGVARALDLGNATSGKRTPTEGNISKKDDIDELSNEVYLAICFLLGADQKLYGKLSEHLHNQHIKGYDD